MHGMEPGLRASERLLEQNDRCLKAGEPRVFPDPAPQFEDGIDMLELLVSVQRGNIAADIFVENGGNVAQPLDIGIELTGNLELEIAVTVGGAHLLERFGQAVVQALAWVEVRGRQRVDQSDGV